MNISDFLKYPARIERDADTNAYAVFVKYEGGQWATSGETYEEALDMAFSVIYDSAEYLAGKEPIPSSGSHEDGDVDICVPYDLALKFMLRNAMLEERWRLSDVAKKLGYSPQKVARFLNFDRATKLESLGEIFELIGRPLSIEC